MTYIRTQQGMVNFLAQLFEIFNCELYQGKLHDSIINVGVLAGNQKSRYVPKVWNDARESMSEIMFSAAFLGANTTQISEISVELLHCMAHQYCDEHNIKGTSRGRAYHNKKFKEVAESHGLVSSCGENAYCGYKDYTIQEGSFVANACKELHGKFLIAREQFTHGSLMLNPPHSRKYVCPCGTIVRATKDVEITCNKCGGKFEIVRKT